MKALILNTDNSVPRQHLDRDFALDSIDLSDIRSSLQFYADRYGRRAFSDSIRSSREDEPTLHFLGSGDFHHLTLMLLEQEAAPFLLVVFDNHSDCSSIGPRYHCGNWLYHASNLPQCSMVLHLGATERQGVLGRYLGIRPLIKKKKLMQLPGRALTAPDFVDTFIDALSFHNPDRVPVYVSVDKDVLNLEESPGDWDNGVMSMIHLSTMLEYLIRVYPVLGADITGEQGGALHYAHKPVKEMLSRIEHRVCQHSSPSISANEKQRAINFELMNIFGVPRVG